MCPTHAAFVVDVQRVVVVEAQGARRAHVDDLVVDFLAAAFLDVFLDLVLVDLNVVLPGSQNGEVGTVGGVDAVVGAAGELELEFIGKRRAVNVVDQGVEHHAVGLEPQR